MNAVSACGGGERSGAERLRSADGIVWVKDAERTILVNGASGATCSLVGVEATIWDLFCLGYRSGGVVPVVGALFRLSRGEAAELLRSTARGWLAAGWLCRDDGDDDAPGGERCGAAGRGG